jgi:hypothetical protein
MAMVVGPAVTVTATMGREAVRRGTDRWSPVRPVVVQLDRADRRQRRDYGVTTAGSMLRSAHCTTAASKALVLAVELAG